MKICHLAYQTWPTQAGSVSRLEQLLSAQLMSDINVFIVSGPFQTGYSSSSLETRRGIKYYRTVKSETEVGFSNAGGLIGRIRKFLRILSFAKQVHKICVSQQPDILHAHATFLVGISAWIVARKLRIPYVYEVRSTWEEDIAGGSFIELQRFIIRFFEKLAIKLSDGTIFISKGLKEHYCGSKYLRNYRIIYNCVEESQSNNEPQKSNKCRIGYIGSLVYYEGLEYLLEAGARLKERGICFSIDIIGSGPLEEFLKALCVKLKLDDVVTFHGRVNAEEIDIYYNKIDVVVLPRKNLLITNRVSGLKPIEAFSRKKIVVASDVDGMKELFTDKIHGLFFRSEDVADLVEKIIWISQNAKATIKLAESGYDLYIKKYTLQSMGAQYDDFYHSLCKR